MSCLITGGYSLPCKSISGIQAVYIAGWNGPGTTYTLGTTSQVNMNQITAFSGVTSSYAGMAGSLYYTFLQDSEQGSFVETGNTNVTAGTSYNDQVIEITLYNPTQTLNDQVNALMRGRWRIIILDQNGNYFLCGQVNPINVTALAAGSGKAYGDNSGYVITFTGKEYSLATQVTTAAAATVISTTIFSE